MNEEVAAKTINLAVTSSKATARTLLRALSKFNQSLKQKKSKKETQKQMKVKEPKHGKQSIKQLIRQGQGVASMDVGDSGMRDFKRIANKYGVDFAIVKDKTADPPKFVTFFKAKDADAITQILKEYSAKQLKKQKGKTEKKESLIQKIKKYKEKADDIPRKEVEKKKEQVL